MTALRPLGRLLLEALIWLLGLALTAMWVGWGP